MSTAAPAGVDGPLVDLLAHGVGGRDDLPLPADVVAVAAGVVLVVTFAGLVVLRRHPTRPGALAGRPVPRRLDGAVSAPAVRGVARTLAVLASLYVGLAAFFGPDDALNPTLYVVYVHLWVGLVPASLLLGPVWRFVSPIRGLHAAACAVAGVDRDVGLADPPKQLGWWPAAAGLAAFVWVELVAPFGSSARALGVLAVAYTAVQLVLGVRYGSRWFERGEAFEAYSSLLGRMAPVGRRDDGVLVLRTPVQGLDTVAAAPGLVAVVAVLVGSAAFDSVQGLRSWLDATQGLDVPTWLVGTVGLVSALALAALLYRLGSPVSTPGGPTPAEMPGLFAHSLLPIAAGYQIAHYTSLLLFEGQRGFLLLSDPLGRGDDWLGVGDRAVDFALVPATAIAVVQVAAVVGGHVLGVFSAHDRAVRLTRPGDVVRSQAPLLVLMVAVTVLGLLLLFAT